MGFRVSGGRKLSVVLGSFGGLGYFEVAGMLRGVGFEAWELGFRV